MPPAFPSTSLAGLIPVSVSTDVLQEAVQESVVLQLARRIPMPAGKTVFPIARGFPSAGWLSAPGGRKPMTSMDIGTTQLVAEEVACIIYIPDSYVEDVGINLWNYARPQLREAIGKALDNAVLWGLGGDGTGTAPTTFTNQTGAGGLFGMAAVYTPGTGADAITAINGAMMAVEGQGLEPTGSLASLALAGSLRNIRDSGGAFLFGTSQAQATGSISSLWGKPLEFRPWKTGTPYSTANFLTGDWTKVIIGVRNDISYEMSSDAVIYNTDGTVAMSGFQDDTTAMRVRARFGLAVIRPATASVNAAPWANPFAKVLAATPALADVTPGDIPPAAAAEMPEAGSGPGTPRAR
jgi:HK97 family phage major capsid protein